MKSNQTPGSNPIAAPPVRTVPPQVARGGGRGKRAGGRGSNTAGRGQARVFALSQQDANASNAVVTGILTVCSHRARVLFDSGSTHSYVSPLFAAKLGRKPSRMEEFVMVVTPSGETLWVEFVYETCLVMVEGRETIVDLMVLEMVDLDVILGMDWLASCHAVVDCRSKKLKFEMPNEPSFEYYGDGALAPMRLISALEARKSLCSGCQAYLAVVRDVNQQVSSLEQVPVVKEFQDVFPEELPGLPPDREIEFEIDLAPGTQPISIPPYRMAPKELKEL